MEKHQNLIVLIRETKYGTEAGVFSTQENVDSIISDDKEFARVTSRIDKEDWENMDDGEIYTCTGCSWNTYHVELDKAFGWRF